MGQIQRGLVPLIEDLDRRARPGRPSRNRPLQRYVSVVDSVTFTSEVVTVTMTTPPYQFTRESYRAAVKAEASLISYWRLGEYSPKVTAEDEQNTNHGTYMNSPLLGATGPALSEPNLAARFTAGSSHYVRVLTSTSL